MQEGSVPIRYGLVRFSDSGLQYLTARDSLFPNCDDAVLGGCVVGQRQTNRRTFVGLATQPEILGVSVRSRLLRPALPSRLVPAPAALQWASRTDGKKSVVEFPEQDQALRFDGVEPPVLGRTGSRQMQDKATCRIGRVTLP